MALLQGFIEEQPGIADPGLQDPGGRAQLVDEVGWVEGFAAVEALERRRALRVRAEKAKAMADREGGFQQIYPDRTGADFDACERESRLLMEELLRRVEGFDGVGAEKTQERAAIHELFGRLIGWTRLGLEALVEELMREGIKVAKAAGVTLEEEFFDYGMQYLRKAGYHRTSMHQDVERGTPTEIDWLSAKIVEQGRAYGVETPYNFTITALVKGLELKSKAPDQ